MFRQSIFLKDITSEYNPVEAWMYDTFFAPAILKMVRKELRVLCSKLPPDARVLDVGCGGGQIPFALAEMQPDVHVTGIDLVPQQISRARKRTKGISDRMQLDVGSALELPYNADQFEAVLSVTSIKHWSGQKEGLRECLRVLKPGGQLLIAEVDRGCVLDDMRNMMNCSRLPRMLRGFAMPLLRTFIVGQGVDLEDLRAFAAELPLEDQRIARIPDMPGVIMVGRLSDGVQ